ncbi:MAG: hypothetical protein WDO18_20890 [Acidobacteriota bacterium]
MAKYKPAGGKKKETPDSKRGLVPCAVIIIVLLGLVSALFFVALQSSGTK